MKLSELREAYEAGERRFWNQQFEIASYAELKFSGCDFTGSSFERANVFFSAFNDCVFDEVTFDGAVFTAGAIKDCVFRSAHWSGARFSGTQLTRCDFRGVGWRATMFDDAILSSCRFDGGKLEGVNFRHTRINGCVFDRSTLTDVIFVDTSLADVAAAEDMTLTSCSVDWSAICVSLRSPHLREFLLRSGIPEIFVTYMVECAASLDPQMLLRLMQSTFISYGGPDINFARHLQQELKRNGVHTFFFETDAIPGTFLHEVMWDGVNDYDRVLLICSAKSLARPGVLNEIEQTLARETRDGGRAYLLPITLDDHVFTWCPDRAYLGDIIRGRVIADFRDAPPNSMKFRSALSRVLQALRKRPKTY